MILDVWSENLLLVLRLKFTGIRIPHPRTAITRNMFLNMRVNRKNIVASIPIIGISSCSFDFITGEIHAKKPLPIGGGA
jgi:hypothetical protein